MFHLLKNFRSSHHPEHDSATLNSLHNEGRPSRNTKHPNIFKFMNNNATYRLPGSSWLHFGSLRAQLDPPLRHRMILPRLALLHAPFHAQHGAAPEVLPTAQLVCFVPAMNTRMNMVQTCKICISRQCARTIAHTFNLTRIKPFLELSFLRRTQILVGCT